jgi:5-hydroxyisourate hydrolase
MSTVSTHVLDTSLGRPAAGVPLFLERKAHEGWEPIGQGVTDAGGRAGGLVTDDQPLREGVYRLSFDTNTYFDARGIDAFYPVVRVVFRIGKDAQHYHVPLLLSPFGYSTYRGA